MHEFLFYALSTFVGFTAAFVLLYFFAEWREKRQQEKYKTGIWGK
ncbi:hypothetical protein [Bilophila sp.]|jgi:hypothetical protein